MLVPSDVEKFRKRFRWNGNPLTPADCACEPSCYTGSIKRCHHSPLDEPDPPGTTKLDCLPEASLPGIIRQYHWSWKEQRGHFCQTINSAYPQFVPPFTFPPIRLRQVAPLPITSQTSSKTLSLLKQPFVRAQPILYNLSISLARSPPPPPWTGITTMD